MVVVGLAGLVMVDVPGLLNNAVHVPVPVAAIVAEPPGRMIQLTVWSGPAFGFAVTVIFTVSVQLPFVHIYAYVPAALKVVIVVVGLDGVVMVEVPGLPANAVHVPVPVAAIVAEPPGRIAQFTVWSGPAFGFAVTMTLAVSVQPPLVQMNLYVPAALNVVMVVVGLAGVVMVEVPGLPA